MIGDNMANPYVVSYSLRDAPEEILKKNVPASDALRAANALRKELSENNTVESKGDVKVMEIKLGF